VPKGICEYDVMGSIRGEPVDLVKCETVDLYVPATSEIVIEGYLQLDPKNWDMEGPFAEFTGYVAGDKSPKPTIRVTAITHRNNPILRGTIEGSLPGSYSENGICSSIMRASTAWNVLDRAGVPGVTDVWCPPVQTGINLLIRMKSSYRNQAAQRVNAGEDDIIIMRSTFGAGLDPSTRKRDRNPALFGTGKWNRVLIDATMNLDYDPDPELDGARFPPKVWPEQSDIDAAMKRWGEFGLKKPNGG
jgi:3-polyprenyl-4-hydroxybenzoate decarboxylase